MGLHVSTAYLYWVLSSEVSCQWCGNYITEVILSSQSVSHSVNQSSQSGREFGVFPPADRSRSISLNSVFSLPYDTKRQTKPRNPVVLTVVYHHQKTLELIYRYLFSSSCDKHVKRRIQPPCYASILCTSFKECVIMKSQYRWKSFKWINRLSHGVRCCCVVYDVVPFYVRVIKDVIVCQGHE